MRPFRFGVMLSEYFAPDSPLPRTRGGWAEKARQIEDLGYSTLFLTDHFSTAFAPLVALMAAADATTRLRIGTLVIASDYRNPLVLAKEASTLDLLSDGRLELGLGAGWMAADYRMAGMAFDAVGVRIARMEETARVLKCVLAGEPTTFSGEHVRVEAPAGLATARQRPHPPLLIAGGGRKVLSAAARHADIVGVNFTIRGGVLGTNLATATSDGMRERVGWVREAAGPRFRDIELNVTPLAAVTRDRAAVAARVSPLFAQPPEEVLASPLLLAGSTEQIIEELIARREAYGFSYVVFTGGDEAALAPVVARLTGQ
jgi:probable F420-dependent oxidoreductase